MLTKVAHQVLVNHFVADRCRIEFLEPEFDSVLIQRSLRSAHAELVDIEESWVHLIHDQAFSLLEIVRLLELQPGLLHCVDIHETRVLIHRRHLRDVLG